jgi:tRNA A-37 threonylcarbamoyl transferase component Bud32
MIRKLEKYEILEEIGHGGMATVYRAHDTVLDRPVALKVMHPHLRAAEEARKRFHREARSVARLRHPRVLEIYDFSGESSEEAYIAAELLTGPTLKIWREAQKDVPAEIAACFVIEIAGALDAAHAAQVVHRDVKPENVLLHENRTLKLTDFGIADMIDAVSMTATGQILGSPGHMAPEQIEGKDCDARTDLFSLGTVLYYLATGRLPFTGRNPHQVLKRIIDGEYADPLRVNPTIGGRLRAMIVKALERDPNARYQSARELIAELKDFIAEAGIEDSGKMLERYLQDPAKVGEEVRRQTIDRLIEHGARASDAGDVPKALDYYNRVLALDEGNERVLKLIERVGMDRRRRVILRAAAALTLFGGAMAATAWMLWPGPQIIDEHDPPIASAIDAGSIADAGRTVIASSGDAGGRAVIASLPDAGSRVVIATLGDSGRARDPVVRTREPRTVRLRITPANALFAVPPNAERVEYGMTRTVELAPGRHQIGVFPGPEVANVYEAHTFEVTVPSGEGEHEVALQLPIADAALYVRCTAPDARVSVDNGRVTGRANDTIFVPMRRASENLSVRVTAPGYRSFSTRENIPFAAGEPTRELEVTLEAENEIANGP